MQACRSWPREGRSARNPGVGLLRAQLAPTTLSLRPAHHIPGKHRVLVVGVKRDPARANGMQAVINFLGAAGHWPTFARCENSHADTHSKSCSAWETSSSSASLSEKSGTGARLLCCAFLLPLAEVRKLSTRLGTGRCSKVMAWSCGVGPGCAKARVRDCTQAAGKMELGASN